MIYATTTPGKIINAGIDPMEKTEDWTEPHIYGQETLSTEQTEDGELKINKPLQKNTDLVKLIEECQEYLHYNQKNTKTVESLSQIKILGS